MTISPPSRRGTFCSWLIVALVTFVSAGSALAQIAPSLTVTETLKRSAKKQGSGADSFYFQAGSWRTAFTIKLPLTPGASMDNIGVEDILTMSIGEYSFEGAFADAVINRTKREAVFSLVAEDEFTPTGTITVTWTADGVSIIGKVAAADPDATTVYPLDSADGRGRINDTMGAAVEISGSPESDEPRAFKEWQAIKVNGTERFREVNRRGESFLDGTHSITGTADNVRPTVTVSASRKDVRLEDGRDAVTFTGTARDNIEVSGVLVRVDGGEAEEVTTFESNANGKKGEWTYETGALEAGPHRFEFTAIDHDGLLSLPTVRTVTVVKSATLTVTQQGLGKITLRRVYPSGGSVQLVSNFVPGSPVELEAGATYWLEAVPAVGDWAFGSWSGDVEGADEAGSSFTFVLPDIGDVSLVANFVPNPYPALAGSYSLQFGVSDDAASLMSIGTLQFTVTPTRGSVTGKIFLGGATDGIPFSGQLRADGTLRLLVNATPHLRLAVEIVVDSETDPTDPGVSGTVVGYNTDPEDPLFEVDAVGFRSFWKTGGATVPGELIGNYTLVLEAADLVDDRGIVLPHGYATASVTAPGNVTLTGALPNGTPFSFAGELSQSGELLVRVPVSGGLIAGRITIGLDGAKPTIEAMLYWSFEESDAATGESEFMQVSVEASGERFVPPTVDRGLFPNSNGTGAIAITAYVVAEDNSLGAEEIVRAVTLTAANTVDVESDPLLEPVTVAVDLNNGRVSGSFVHPGTGRLITFRGVVLQDGLRAVGHYKDGTDIGPFEISLSEATVTVAAQ